MSEELNYQAENGINNRGSRTQMIILGSGIFIATFDLAAISIAMLVLKGIWHLSPITVTLIGAAALIGAIFGGFLGLISAIRGKETAKSAPITKPTICRKKISQIEGCNKYARTQNYHLGSRTPVINSILSLIIKFFTHYFISNSNVRISLHHIFILKSFIQNI